MKKAILSTFILVAGYLFVQAQGSFTIKDKDGSSINGMTLDFVADTGNPVMSYAFDVLNTSSTPKYVHMKRQIITEVLNTQNYFCWDVCYPPFVSASTNSVSINNSAMYTLGTVDYMPQGQIGLTTIRYVVFDSQNTNDSAWFVARYNATGLGMNEPVSGTLQSAFPNPSSVQTAISYQLNGTSKGSIRLYNMLGDLVKELALNNAKGTVTLPVSELENGIYFYSLVGNDKVLATRKMIVTR